MATWNLTLEQWAPLSARQLALGGARSGLAQRRVRERIAAEAFAQRVPKASCRRRVGVQVLAGARHQSPAEAYWPSLVDALEFAGLVLDATPESVVQGELAVRRSARRRGVRRCAIITLQDVDAPG
jgi:hypothetical protein